MKNHAQVLVVDDDETDRRLLEAILAREGYQVRFAINGAEGLEQALEAPPDLVILDATMPLLNGIETCGRLKALERTRLIPVVLLTTASGEEDRVRGLKVGADDFLSKPLNPIEVVARVRSSLRHKQLIDQLERTEMVIFNLARMAEAKAAYTEAHLRRMAAWAERLARALGLSEDEVVAARYGGILHDIGTIAISEAILTKPGKLTAAEWEEIKKHPVIGEEIIRPLRFAGRVGPIVRGHHEHWDGQGYPDGLRGERIPLGARMVAVCDGWDAMTSDRPYRRALPKSEALRSFREGAGKRWDPALVGIFIGFLD